MKLVDRILVIDDDVELCGLVGEYLAPEGFQVESAADGNRGLEQALIEAMRSVWLTDTPRGPFHFDRFGNVVSDLFIRRCEKKDGNSSTRRSRPIRPSASSGPTTRNGFFRNRSIPAITHR